MKKGTKKKSGTFIFKDNRTLLEMLALRSVGYSFDFLAELLNCDRTSIRYQCRKYKIFPLKTKYVRNSKEVFNLKRISENIIEKTNPERIRHWSKIDGEKVNTGKSYADYLKTISPYNYK